MKRKRSMPATGPIKSNRTQLMALMTKLYKPKKGAMMALWSMTEEQAGVVLQDMLKAAEDEEGEPHA